MLPVSILEFAISMSKSPISNLRDLPSLTHLIAFRDTMLYSVCFPSPKYRAASPTFNRRLSLLIINPSAYFFVRFHVMIERILSQTFVQLLLINSIALCYPPSSYRYRLTAAATYICMFMSTSLLANAISLIDISAIF